MKSIDVRSSQASHSRLAWVDYAKGIGIILVVYGHVARGLMSSGWAAHSDLLQTVDRVIYSFHMPLFFLLSGLFFFGSISSKGRSTFFASKVDTLLYPYFIWSIFQGIVQLTFSNYTNEQLSFLDLFSLFTSPRAQFWYLYALFLVSIVAAIFFRPKPLLWGTVCIAVFLLMSLCAQPPYAAPAIKYLSEYTIYFALGAYLGLHINSISANIRLRKTPVILLVLFCLAHAQLVDPKAFGLYSNFIDFITAILGVSAVVSLSLWLANASRLGWLRSLGEASLSIFIFHILFTAGSRVILKTGFGISSLPPQIALGVLAGCLGPYFIYRYVVSRDVSGVFSSPRTISAVRWLQRARESRGPAG